VYKRSKSPPSLAPCARRGKKGERRRGCARGRGADKKRKKGIRFTRRFPRGKKGEGKNRALAIRKRGEKNTLLRGAFGKL